MKTILTGFLILIWSGLAIAQNFTSLKDQKLTLDNGTIKRIIKLNEGDKGIRSVSMQLDNNSEDFLDESTEEFYFEFDGKPLTGLDQWILVSVENITGDYQGSGALPGSPILTRISGSANG